MLTYSEVELLGISVTPGNCLATPGASVTRKILDLAGRSDVSVSAGVLEGPNPFPLAWRLDSLKVDRLPILNRADSVRAPLDQRPAHEYLAQRILEAPRPVTLLMTGPLTNLAWCLDHHPEIEGRVQEVLFMGGALEVPGNVDLPGHDGSAEWNVYWDPGAAKRVWDSSVPLRLFPLDATDQVEVTAEFCESFGRQYEYPFSSAAGAVWAMTFGTRESTGLPYYCWDSLTASYLGRPDLCEFREVTCDVVTKGPSEGRTASSRNGRPVQMAVRVDREGFYRHCLESLRR